MKRALRQASRPFFPDVIAAEAPEPAELALRARIRQPQDLGPLAVRARGDVSAIFLGGRGHVP